MAAGAITLGCLALLVLHAFELPGPFTWAYAHLGRQRWLVVLAALVVAVLPPLTAWIWRRPWAAAPVATLGPRRVALLVALGTAVVTVVGLAWPVTPICIDAWYFATSVAEGASGSPRWYLTLWTFGSVAPLLQPLMAPFTVVRVLNCMVAAWALAALAAAARTLGRTEGEAAALTAVVWTSFGVLQLALGYIDVYPAALCWTGLYLWTGSGVLLRDRRPLWALAVAAAAPFFYIGLVLLAPSCLVLLWVVARRHGAGRVMEALGAAFVVAGLATLPGYGMPFSWAAFAHDLAPALAPGAPVDGRGALLPAAEIATAWHWLGIAHLLLLVDGLGVLLLISCGPAAIRRAPRPVVLWAVMLLVPTLAYVATMDPLFGLFADWDLFSYVAAITALWGAYAFVVWGRRAPRSFPILLGFVLATALVHLMARLNALDVDFHRHLAETPFRVPVDKPGPAPGGAAS